VTEFTEENLRNAASRLRRKAEEQLDEFTIARLRALRLNAVAAAPARRRFWGIAGAVAAAGMTLAIAGLLWLKSPSEPAPAAPVSEASLTDLDLLTTENPDFYGNLDFYRWLASQSSQG
jgi:hypothetical protein